MSALGWLCRSVGSERVDLIAFVLFSVLKVNLEYPQFLGQVN